MPYGFTNSNFSFNKPKRRRKSVKRSRVYRPKAKPHYSFKRAVRKEAHGILGGMVSTAKGMVTHPIRTTKNVAKGTAHYYKGYRHPIRQIKNNPIGVALDAASLAAAPFTFGTSAGARAATILAKTGKMRTAAKVRRATRKRVSKVTHTHKNVSVEKIITGNPMQRARKVGLDKTLTKFFPQSYSKRVVDSHTSKAKVSVHHALNDVMSRGKRLSNKASPNDRIKVHDHLIKTLHQAAAQNSHWIPVKLNAKGKLVLPGGKIAIRHPKLMGKHQTRLVNKNVEGSKFLHYLDNADQFLSTNHVKGAVIKNGKVLVIDKKAFKGITGEYAKSASAIGKIYTKTTDVWRYMILNIPPRFLVNNVVGNTLMAGLHNGGYTMARAFYDSTVQHKGAKAAMRDLKRGGVDKALKSRVNDLFPEHFSTSFAAEAVGSAPKWVKKIGMLPLTQRIAENGIRSVVIRTKIRKSAQFKKLRKKGFSTEEAMYRAVKKNKTLRDSISQQVFREMGQYHHMSKSERFIRGAVPFYSWNRAIARSTATALTDHPIRFNIMGELSKAGVAQSEKDFGPGMPDFLRGATPVGGIGRVERGRQPIITPQGLNPFASNIEQYDIANALIGGHGPNLTESAGTQLNPLIQGSMEAIRGKSLLTGKDIEPIHGFLGGPRTALRQGFHNLPELQLGRDLYAAQFKKKRRRRRSKKLYKGGTKQHFLNFLGYPYKDMRIDTAKYLARLNGGAY